MGKEGNPAIANVSVTPKTQCNFKNNKMWKPMFLGIGNRKFSVAEKPNTILKKRSGVGGGETFKIYKNQGSNAEVHLENNYHGHEFWV